MKYGLWLSKYKGQEMNTWVYVNGERVEGEHTYDLSEHLSHFQKLNPLGIYSVKPIEE